MSVKTLYTCDICKSVEVCRPCLESLGIHDRRPEPEKKANPAPTVEDLVRQIVREELEKRPQHIITINAGKRPNREDVIKEIKDALRTQPMPTRPNPIVPERRG